MNDIPQEKPMFVFGKEDYKWSEEQVKRWREKGVGQHFIGVTVGPDDHFLKTWKEKLSLDHHFLGKGKHRFVYAVDPYRTPAEGTMFEKLPDGNVRWIPMNDLNPDILDRVSGIIKSHFNHYSKSKLILEKMSETNFQKTLEWGVELGVEIAKDLEDSKLTLGEALGLWDNALRIGGIVKGLKSIPAEWEANKDSEEFMDAIIAGVQQKVKGLESDLAKRIVIQAIKTGIETGKLIDLCIEAAAQTKK